ncbi:hypothetical protein [uncultured Thiohalocapsa sp.]|uniref:hypothetical protein n=1 Tax=uncultured Thiohalocapsa sp. TaxID=768990 RepID=UPI0025E08509|nr:hypothetical protein [uncultured Thiohalocapsa sp.]
MTKSHATDATPSADGAVTLPGAKLAFEEPRLTFAEPQLVPRGDLRDVTAGAFGSFSNVDQFPPPPGPL